MEAGTIDEGEARVITAPRYLFRNVALLALCQGVHVSIISMTITVSVLISTHYAPSPVMMTLPVAVQMLGMLLFSFPLAKLITRIGRRPAFLIGVLVAMMGTSVIALGMVWSWWWLMVVGYFCLGGGMSIGGFFVFAANDGAPLAWGGRINGAILLGGLVAAVAGPNVGHHAVGLATDTALIAVAGAMFGFLLIQGVLLSGLKVLPGAKPLQSMTAIQVRRVAARPTFWAAALVAGCGYGAMTLIMNATTPWMHDRAMNMDHSSAVISFHLLGMFALAPVSGWVCDRFGVSIGALLGFGIIALCMAILAVLGQEYAHFMTSLILLGGGWSLTMVAGTKMVVILGRSDDLPAYELGGVLVISLANILGSVGAGVVYHLGDWHGVLGVSLAVVMLGMAAVAFRLKAIQGATH